MFRDPETRDIVPRWTPAEAHLHTSTGESQDTFLPGIPPLQAGLIRHRPAPDHLRSVGQRHSGRTGIWGVGGHAPVKNGKTRAAWEARISVPPRSTAPSWQRHPASVPLWPKLIRFQSELDSSQQRSRQCVEKAHPMGSRRLLRVMPLARHTPALRPSLRARCEPERDGVTQRGTPRSNAVEVASVWTRCSRRMSTGCCG